MRKENKALKLVVDAGFFTVVAFMLSAMAWVASLCIQIMFNSFGVFGATFALTAFALFAYKLYNLE